MNNLYLNTEIFLSLIFFAKILSILNYFSTMCVNTIKRLLKSHYNIGYTYYFYNMELNYIVNVYLYRIGYK